MIKIVTIEATYNIPEDDEYVDDSPIDEDVIKDILTFTELVNLMKSYSEASCYPASGSVNEWLTFSTSSYIDGSMTEYSLHYDRDNAAHNKKYWTLAMKAAGFVK
jgi:hypothetical protein